MNKSKIISSAVICFVVVGCSSSTDINPNSIAKKQYSERRSVDWCQKNYSSASVSTRDRQRSAKHCDSQARQAYLKAKKDKEYKEN